MCLFQCRAQISVDFVDMGSISVIGLTFLSVFGQRVYYCMIDLRLLSLTFESLQCHGCCCLECVDKYVFFISYGLSYLTSLTPTINTAKSTLFIYSNNFLFKTNFIPYIYFRYKLLVVSQMQRYGLKHVNRITNTNLNSALKVKS